MYQIEDSPWSEVFGSFWHVSKTTKLAPILFTFDRFRDFTFLYKQTVDVLVHLNDVLLVIVETLCSSANAVCLLHKEQICYKIRCLCFTCFSVLCVHFTTSEQVLQSSHEIYSLTNVLFYSTDYSIIM